MNTKHVLTQAADWLEKIRRFQALAVQHKTANQRLSTEASTAEELIEGILDFVAWCISNPEEDEAIEDPVGLLYWLRAQRDSPRLIDEAWRTLDPGRRLEGAGRLFWSLEAARLHHAEWGGFLVVLDEAERADQYLVCEEIPEWKLSEYAHVEESAWQHVEWDATRLFSCPRCEGATPRKGLPCEPCFRTAAAQLS